MGIRRFNDSNGRLAWVLTHVDAVIGLDGRSLSQILGDMQKDIEAAAASGGIEDGSDKEIWNMTPGHIYTKDGKMYICTKASGDHLLDYEAIVFEPGGGYPTYSPGCIRIQGRSENYDVSGENHVYNHVFATMSQVDVAINTAIQGISFEDGVKTATLKDSPVDSLATLTLQREATTSPNDIVVDFPYASSNEAGLMSAADKTIVESLNTSVTLDDSTVMSMSASQIRSKYLGMGNNGKVFVINKDTILIASQSVSVSPYHITISEVQINPVTGILIRSSSDLGAWSSWQTPSMLGVVHAPTAAAGTNTTQIATTEFVQTAIADFKPVVVLTQAEFDALTNPDNNTLYMILENTANSGT